jgi:light-harvesting complex I chlorophyll a/b binding protein 1
MMFLAICLLAASALTLALHSPLTKAPSAVSPLKVVIDADTPGLGITGVFDPLGLSAKLTPADFKKYQEAELKHGRISMLATLGFFAAERFHPLFGGDIEGAAIYHFQVRLTTVPLSHTDCLTCRRSSLCCLRSGWPWC